MKKILMLFISILFLASGCGQQTKEDIIKDMSDNVNKSKSYILKGSMEISNDEETFNYSLESYYLKDDFYKVILVNQTNNHEQIILKSKEDVYVITPTLNKSFKFESDWPNNSSQAYILSNIVKDVTNDKNSEIETKENGYIIKSKVNYPNNEDLKYQKIYLNDKKIIEKVEVYNESDIIKIKVIFTDINLKANLKEEDFKLEAYVKEEPLETDTKNNDNEVKNENDKKCENNENCENQDNKSTESNEQTANIENIIYPLYIPSNTFLSNSEKVTTTNGNRVILTFSGEKNFVIIEEKAMANKNMEIIPVYGEPLMLSETIGALSVNSLNWDVNNISYYLASTELTTQEMQSIANSLGNTTLVNNLK